MRWVSFIILASLLVSCVSQPRRKEVQLSEAKKLWELFWENQAKKREVTRRVQGKIRLQLTDKHQSISGNGSFYSSPEGLRIELRDPLGRLQYINVLKGKSIFSAYYPTQSKVYFDRVQGRAYLRDFLGLEINFYELKELWLGILPFKKSEAQLEKAIDLEGQGQTLLTFNGGGFQSEVSIDSQSGEALNFNLKTAHFDAHFEFSEFARCCEEQLSQNELPRLARNVFLKIENERTEIDLDWVEIIPALKTPPGLFTLGLLPNTKQIEIK